MVLSRDSAVAELAPGVASPRSFVAASGPAALGSAALGPAAPDSFWPQLGRVVGGLPGTVRVLVVRLDGAAQLDGAPQLDGGAHRWPEPVGADDSATVAAVCAVLRQPAGVSVAVLDGDVDGAGLQLALSCDLILATDTTTVAFAAAGPDVRVAGIGRVVRLLGRSRAAALSLAGDRMRADDPALAGLFWRVCAAPESGPTLDGLLDRLLARPRAALTETKALLDSAQEPGAADQEAAESDAAARIRAELLGDIAEDPADLQLG